MLKTILLAAALSVGFMVSAQAADCAGDFARVEAAISTGKASAADKTAAMALEKKAKAHQKAGNKAGACAALKEAKMKLGVK